MEFFNTIVSISHSSIITLLLNHSYITSYLLIILWNIYVAPLICQHKYNKDSTTKVVKLSDKPIIIAKMPHKLLYICHSSKRIFDEQFNFLPYLISKFLVAYNHLQCCFCTVLLPGCFCLAYHCFL